MEGKTCPVIEDGERCGQPARARGWCNKHYLRWKAHGDPLVTLTNKRPLSSPICTYEDCPKPARTRDLCDTHYYRLRKHGDPGIVSVVRHTGAPAERFWAKVNKVDTGCWLWMAHKNAGGYGTFRVNGKMVLAYRFSYELEHDPVPEGLFLDHRCGVRACVNPAHLRVVTRKQNGENLTVIQSNNTSGVRGVSWDKGMRMWRVSVGHNGKLYYGGCYANIKDAEAAAINKRNELFTHNDKDRESA